MAEKSIIAWTHNTFNPWMGCTKVSPGCAHCYAETLTKNRMGLSLWGSRGTRQVTSIANWKKPLQWNREAEGKGQRLRTFCASLCDWSEDHPVAAATRPRLWDLIRRTPWLDWQLLSKRHETIADNLPSDWGDGYPNVWLGVSIESDDYAHRADYLRKIPATVRFVSYEPAIGPLGTLDVAGIDWVIYGGESGPGYRKEDKQWARDMKAKCETETERRQSVGDPTVCAFFHKQSAAYRTEIGIELDGQVVRNYPQPRLSLPALFG